LIPFLPLFLQNIPISKIGAQDVTAKKGSKRYWPLAAAMIDISLKLRELNPFA
jgi:hypothetical protein